MALYALAVPKLSGSAESFVEHFRHRFDPVAGSVPAHFTLVFGADEALKLPLIDAVQRLAAETCPFSVTLRDVTIVEDPHSGAALVELLPSEGVQALGDLHQILHDGPIAAARLRGPFQPHITIGRFDTVEKATGALQELDRNVLRFEMSIETLSVVESTNGDTRTLRSFSLRRR